MHPEPPGFDIRVSYEMCAGQNARAAVPGPACQYGWYTTNYVVVGIKPVHLHQQLVQRLSFSLLLSALRTDPMASISSMNITAGLLGPSQIPILLAPTPDVLFHELSRWHI